MVPVLSYVAKPQRERFIAFTNRYLLAPATRHGKPATPAENCNVGLFSSIESEFIC